MYGNITPDLARARFNDRLAQAEASRLAATAREARPSRPRRTIASVLRLPRLRSMTDRPAT